ncbi:MAG: rhombosortase [Gammaproteobacteria bacterium]|nr:rhombosortase [Gammaproteobacteria bacterium]
MTLSQFRASRLAHLGLPLTLALCMTLVALGGSELSALLRFEREAILHGQLWRLFSGHLTHLGWSHLWLNIAGLALIWGLVGRCFSLRQWLSISAGLALGIGLGLLVFNPQLAWYVGLSGVLHGMLVAGGIAEVRAGRGSSYVLLILVGAKLVWEQVAGPLPGSTAGAGGAVIVDAHLYGALCGIMFGGILKPAGLRDRPDRAN